MNVTMELIIATLIFSIFLILLWYKNTHKTIILRKIRVINFINRYPQCSVALFDNGKEYYLPELFTCGQENIRDGRVVDVKITNGTVVWVGKLGD